MISDNSSILDFLTLSHRVSLDSLGAVLFLLFPEPMHTLFSMNCFFRLLKGASCDLTTKTKLIRIGDLAVKKNNKKNAQTQ